MERVITTYLSKVDQIPDDYEILLISRILPKYFRMDRGNMYRVLEFAPSKGLLFSYRRNPDWARYTLLFNREKALDKKYREYIDRLAVAVNSGKKFALVCYEKDYLNCHRSLVAEDIKRRYNINWEEML